MRTRTATMVLTEEPPVAVAIDWYTMCAWCGQEFMVQGESLIPEHPCAVGGPCGGSLTPGCKIEPCAERPETA